VIRIATYNLLHGMPVLGGMPQPVRDGDGKFVGPPEHTDDTLLRESAAALDADVIGLQEVDRHQPRSGGYDQTAVVADALGAGHHLFAPSLIGTPGSSDDWHPATADDDIDPAGDSDTRPMYGVGLVSRLPVLQWRIERFPPARASLPLMIPGEGRRPRVMTVADEPRSAVIAVIEGPNGPFTVATAHLSFVPVTNGRQLRELVRRTRDLPRPFLLFGDFNLPGRWPRRLTGFRSLAAGATYPTFSPKIQFDHVLADGLPDEVRTSATVHALPVSDHCAVSVDIDGL